MSKRTKIPAHRIDTSHHVPTGDVVLRLAAVSKTYTTGPVSVRALDQVSMSLTRGSFTAVMGPSGSGKTTLLQCAAGLDTPTDGAALIDGIDMAGMNETQRTKFRRGRVGFIFQQFNLLPTLTVAENVALPAQIARLDVDTPRCEALLERVGLADRGDHRPAQLSGGQQQRAAIARALVAQPSILFADEPTGALDSHSATNVLELLRQSVDELGQTLVMVTHDPVAAAYADTVVFMRDGQLVDTLEQPTAAAIAHRMTQLDACAASLLTQPGA